MPEIKGDRTDV